MNKTVHVPAALVAMAALAGMLLHAANAHGAEAEDPLQVSLFAGAAYDDNIYRLEDDSDALLTLGSAKLDDWYRYGGVDLKANLAGDRRRLDVDAEIYRQTYDQFGDLDHTGGHFNAAGEWELSSSTNGNLGYLFDRRLQSFTNKDTTRKNIIQRNRLDAGVEHTLAQRWQVRVQGDAINYDFSSSDFLNKQQFDGEAEIRYAASQRSIFGLLAAYTASNFDSNDSRDYTGWSLGPSFHWQLTSSIQVAANVGYTHRALDSAGDLSDYDGVTGFVSSRWEPGKRFSSELRAYRDVSDLGGEVSEYTERTGLSWRPTWQMTAKLSTRFGVTVERRDFTAAPGERDRKDDYLLADLWVDFQTTRRLLFSLGYTLEHRDSNQALEDFDDNVFSGEARFTF